MTAAEIIQAAKAEGLLVALSSTGTIKATGEQEVVNRWRPALLEHKAEIIHLLSTLTENTSPAIGLPCGGCSRLEIIEIQGVLVSGCLYEILGAEFSEGWKRLPSDLKQCIFN